MPTIVKILKSWLICALENMLCHISVQGFLISQIEKQVFLINFILGGTTYLFITMIALKKN